MIHFRKAKQSDASQIRILIKTILDDNGIIVNREKIDEDLSDLGTYYFAQNGWFGVIESDDQIIACYGIFRIDNATCELRKMYVDLSIQRQGLGKKRMTRLKMNKRILWLGKKTLVINTPKY